MSIVDPIGVGGFHEMVRYFMAVQETYEPEVLKYSQIAIPSFEDMAYWNKLVNNLVFRERVDKENFVYRPARIDQLSILMARRIGKHALERDQRYVGVDGIPGIPVTMFWHQKRDGRIRDYPVLPGEK